MNEKIGRVYFGILGIITLIFGISDLIVTIGGNNFLGVFLRSPVTCLEGDGEDLL